MDENLQEPLKKLAEALHQVIAQAPEVEEALKEVRDEGYNPLLMLEVTVALTPPGAELDGDGLDADGLDTDGLETSGLDDELDDDADVDESGTLEIELATSEDVPPLADTLVPEGRVQEEEVAHGELATRIGAEDRAFLRSIRIRLD